MPLRLRKWRKMTPSDLVLEFGRLLPDAHLVKGRDPGFLRRAMENNALDSIDVLWATLRYRDTASARDIPTFVRWLSRNMDIFLEDRLAREGELAAELTHERLPVAALAYYDLIHESIPDARIERAFRESRTILRDYVNATLGAI